MVYVDVPLRDARCIPTPSQPESAAVLALGLPATIDFNLQWIIYLSAQQFEKRAGHFSK
jgi:hypothetical protein